MNEEKINQILKNQFAIMNHLIKETKYTKGDLVDFCFKTENILNPETKPTIRQRTHDALSEESEVEK